MIARARLGGPCFQEPVALRLARRFGGPVVRLYRKLRLSALGKRPIWRRVAGGFLMLIDPCDPMDQAFYLGLYEPHLVRLIRDVVKPGDVCIDVGAHKGYITLHLARAVGPKGRVLAIEPDPRAAEHLRRNLRQNEVGWAFVFECAAAEANGTCEFTLSSQLGWSSRFMNNLARPTALSTVVVHQRCLDDIVQSAGFVPGRDRLSFIKIDVEGSEPLVLSGARRVLEMFRPMLFVEVNRDSLHVAGFGPDAMHSQLRGAGYWCYRIYPSRTPLGYSYTCARATSLLDDRCSTEEILAVHGEQSATRGGLSKLLRRVAGE